MTEQKKMVQMPYLDIRSMLLPGQVPYNTNSSQFLWNRLSRKKTNMGLRTYFFEKFLKKKRRFFLYFSLPLEISGKTKLHPQKFGKILYVTFLRNFKAKKPRPLEISHECFLFSLGNSNLFLTNPWKFCMLFLEQSWKFYILPLPRSPPCLIFFWNSPISKTLGQFKHSPIQQIENNAPLVGFFHNLISMQDVGYKYLALHVDQQLPSR